MPPLTVFGVIISYIPFRLLLFTLIYPLNPICFSITCFLLSAILTVANLVLVQWSTSLCTSTMNPNPRNLLMHVFCRSLNPSWPSLHSTNLNSPFLKQMKSGMPWCTEQRYCSSSSVPGWCFSSREQSSSYFLRTFGYTSSLMIFILPPRQTIQPCFSRRLRSSFSDNPWREGNVRRMGT